LFVGIEAVNAENGAGEQDPNRKLAQDQDYDVYQKMVTTQPILAPIYPRMPLPDVMEETPLYVNAKQYARILKRRQQRAKLEMENRISKMKKVRS